MKKIIPAIIIFVLCLGIPLYAQINKELCNEGPSKAALLDNSIKDYLKKEWNENKMPQQNKFSIIKFFKSKAFAAPNSQDEERRRLRQEWKDALGLDVFYPYFKAKEIEDHVKQKTRVSFFNIKGSAEFKDDFKEFQYIFKKKF